MGSPDKPCREFRPPPNLIPRLRAWEDKVEGVRAVESVPRWLYRLCGQLDTTVGGLWREESPYREGELMSSGRSSGPEIGRVGTLGESSGMCGSQRLQKDVGKAYLWPETPKPPASCRPHSPADNTEVGHMKACE